MGGSSAIVKKITGDFIDIILVHICTYYCCLAISSNVTLGDGTTCSLPSTYLHDATSGFYYRTEI